MSPSLCLESMRQSELSLRSVLLRLLVLLLRLEAPPSELLVSVRRLSLRDGAGSDAYVARLCG